MRIQHRDDVLDIHPEPDMERRVQPRRYIDRSRSGEDQRRQQRLGRVCKRPLSALLATPRHDILDTCLHSCLAGGHLPWIAETGRAFLRSASLTTFGASILEQSKARSSRRRCAPSPTRCATPRLDRETIGPPLPVQPVLRSREPSRSVGTP
jgi:hypothetical protein